LGLPAARKLLFVYGVRFAALLSIAGGAASDLPSHFPMSGAEFSIRARTNPPPMVFIKKLSFGGRGESGEFEAGKVIYLAEP